MPSVLRAEHNCFPTRLLWGAVEAAPDRKSALRWRCHPLGATAGPRTVPVRSNIAGGKAGTAPDHLDRATCCGRGPPALRWECQEAPSTPSNAGAILTGRIHCH